MSTRVHATAIVSTGAELAEGVEVGPYCVIGDGVTIGADTVLGPHTVIQGPALIGCRNQIYGQAAIGTDPQDLKFEGEISTVRIGDDNKIREFVTINRGTRGGTGETVIGSGNLLMTGVHVAHDSEVGSRNILANSATLAGHVRVGDFATVGAFSGVHQFCRVGSYAFVGGYTVLTRDALPFIKTVGSRNEAGIFGINTIGLERLGFSRQRIAALKKAYRLLFRKGLTVRTAVEEIRGEDLETPDVRLLLEFIEGSERGFVRSSLEEDD